MLGERLGVVWQSHSCFPVIDLLQPLAHVEDGGDMDHPRGVTGQVLTLDAALKEAL